MWLCAHRFLSSHGGVYKSSTAKDGLPIAQSGLKKGGTGLRTVTPLFDSLGHGSEREVLVDIGGGFCVRRWGRIRIEMGKCSV